MNETKINVNEAIISQIKPLQLSKTSAEGHAEVLAELVKSGDVKALDMATRLRYIINVCEQTIKQIQPECVAEAQAYNGLQKIVINNAKVEAAEVGVKYDYESTGDIEWKELTTKEKIYSTLRKAREEFLKNVTKPMALSDDNTGGEIITINPPLKTSSRSVKITFEQ